MPKDDLSTSQFGSLEDPSTLSWPKERALATVSSGLEKNHLKANKNVLLRKGNNYIFHAVDEGIVIRLSKPGSDLDYISKEMDLARFLHNKGVPVVPPVQLPINPISSNAGVLSFWSFINSYENGQIDFGEFGNLLRKFHTVSNLSGISLPLWNGLGAIATRLSSFTAENSSERSGLQFMVKKFTQIENIIADKLSHIYENRTIIHGDAWNRNTLRTQNGLVLLDFERVAVGPREWDLVPTMLSAKRFGLEKDKLSLFLEAYGREDVDQLTLDILIQLPELWVITFLFQNCSNSPVHREELQKRLHSIQNPQDDTAWEPL